MADQARKGIALQYQMAIGFAVGLIFGLIANTVARDAGWVEFLTTYVTGPIGQIFLRLLFMLVIPLLFERSGFLDMVQRTLVVDCEEATQVKRAMQRKDLDEQTVRAIMATQISRTERLSRADQVIYNNSDLESLQKQVAHLHQLYLTALPGRK